MKKIKISQAKIIDSQKIRALEKKVWQEDVVNKYDVPMFVEFGWCFVAKNEDKIIGAICSFLTKDEEVFVSDWVVDKLYRQQHVGSRLYKKLIQKVRGRNIIALVESSDEPSLIAHKKLGFKIVRKNKNPYDLPGSSHKFIDEILLRLRN